MGERLQRLPRWARILLMAAGIIGPVAGAVSTVVITVIDLKAKARETSQKTEASYETLAPAVKELQVLMADGQGWAERTDEIVHKLADNKKDHERRMVRLETYVEILGDRSSLPSPPPEPVAAAPSPMVDKLKELEREVTRKRAQKTSRPIPEDLNSANMYQQQRVQEMCSPKDPLCGAKGF